MYKSLHCNLIIREGTCRDSHTNTAIYSSGYSFLVFLHWVFVPAGYLYILLFLKAQNQKISAMTLNTVTSSRRRQKNIINIGK